MRFVQLQDRELDTILAALRHWQRTDMDSEIAREHGKPLDVTEIDTLCQHLNCSAPVEFAHECPYCDNEDVEGGSVEIEDDMATQVCYCGDCKAQWVVSFGLFDVVKVSP